MNTQQNISSLKAELRHKNQQLNTSKLKEQQKNISVEKIANLSTSKIQNKNKQKKGNVNDSSHNQLCHQQDQDNYQLNLNTEKFAAAWKLETGLGVITIEKVSQIVTHYFKMVPQLQRRNQEIQILIIYNKGLLQILNKFEDHEKKLLNKLRTMEEFNVKIMKELCSIKNKPFKVPQIKQDDSLFAKFSLRNFKYQPVFKQNDTIDQNYSTKLRNLFKQHLLKPLQCLEFVESKIKELESKQKTVVIQNQIQEAAQLEKKIDIYNWQIKSVTCQNMFDLYDLQQVIKKQLKRLKIGWGEKTEVTQNNQNNFADQIAKIHSGLTKMDQTELQKYLRIQKQTRKRLRRQRVKEQQVFIRACQKAQSENSQLKKDIKHLKQKLIAVDQQLNKTKLQVQFRSMKFKGNKSSMLDQSVMNQSDAMKQNSKKFAKQTQMKMESQLKKFRQENQRLIKIVSQNQAKQLSQPIVMSRIQQKANALKINIDPSWQQTKIIQVLLQKLSESEKKKNQAKSSAGNLGEAHKQDQLVSPNLEQKLFVFGASSEAAFLKTIQQKNQTQDIEQMQNRNKELQKQILQLKKKNEENKKLLQSKDQVLRKTLEEHQADLKLKNSKINELVKQYEQFQNQIKQLRFNNQLLRVKNQWAEKLSQKIINQIENITIQDICPSQSLFVVAELFSKLRNFIDQYKKQIKKEEQNYEQKRQISIRDDISISRNINNLHDQSALSLKSAFPRLKQKKQSQANIILQKQQWHKPGGYEKFKKIKSLTNQGIDEIQRDPRLSKKLPSKKSDEPLRKNSMQNNSSIKQPSKSKPQDKKSSSKQEKRQQYSIQSDSNQKGGKKFHVQKKSSTQLGLPLKQSKKQQLRKTQNFDSLRIEKDADHNNSGIKQFRSNSSVDKSRTQNNKNNQNQLQKVEKFLNFLDHNTSGNVLNDFDSRSQRQKSEQKKQKNQQNQNFNNSSMKILDNSPTRKNQNSINKSFLPEEKSSQNKNQSMIQKSQNNNHNTSLQKQLSKQLQRSKIQQKNIDKSIRKDEKGNGIENQFQNIPNLSRIQSKQIENTSDSPRKITEKMSNQSQNKLRKFANTNSKQETNKNQVKSKKSIENQDQKNKKFSKKSQSLLWLQINQKQQKQFRQQLSRLSQQTSNMGEPSQPIIRINNVTRSPESSLNQPANQPNKSALKQQNQQASRISKFSPSNIDKQNQEQQISLNYSKDPSVFRNKEQPIKTNANSSVVPSSVVPMNAKVHQMLEKDDDPYFHEKILQKIYSLRNDSDSLDFYQLYTRFKQAVQCLDVAEQVNRRWELKYQKFVNSIRNKQNLNQNFQLLIIALLHAKTGR